MQFDLTTLVGGEGQLDRRYDPSQFEAGEDYRVTGTVELHLDVRQEREQYAVTGHVRAPLELTCGRCLEGVPWLVDADIDLRYMAASDDEVPPEREVAPDDFSVALYRDHAIDLGEMLREQFYLAMPMKPLCSESCQGLCSSCGKNRNRESCDCQPRWEDPRLVGLKALLGDRSNGS